MSETMVVRTAACSDYERLLEECQSALVAWKTKREEFIHFGPRGRSAGDALQRLQAEYARAYNRLERHAKSCRSCHFREQFGRKDRPNAEKEEVEARKELSA
jgi:hypothetical protein